MNSKEGAKTVLNLENPFLARRDDGKRRENLDAGH